MEARTGQGETVANTGRRVAAALEEASPLSRKKSA